MSEEKPENQRSRGGRKPPSEKNKPSVQKHPSRQYFNKLTEIEHLSEKYKHVIRLVFNQRSYKEAGMIACGYTEKSSGTMVSCIMNCEAGQKYLDQLYQIRNEAEDELVERWKKETEMLAFTDRSKIVEKITRQNLFTIPFDQWPADVRACIKGVKKNANGSIEVLFESKVPALESLGKHLGVYLKDNKQKDAEKESVVFYLPDNGRDIKKEAGK